MSNKTAGGADPTRTFGATTQKCTRQACAAAGTPSRVLLRLLLLSAGANEFALARAVNARTRRRSAVAAGAGSTAAAGRSLGRRRRTPAGAAGGSSRPGLAGDLSRALRARRGRGCCGRRTLRGVVLLLLAASVVVLVGHGVCGWWERKEGECECGRGLAPESYKGMTASAEAAAARGELGAALVGPPFVCLRARHASILHRLAQRIVQLSALVFLPVEAVCGVLQPVASIADAPAAQDKIGVLVPIRSL